MLSQGLGGTPVSARGMAGQIQAQVTSLQPGMGGGRKAAQELAGQWMGNCSGATTGLVGQESGMAIGSRAPQGLTSQYRKVSNSEEAVSRDWTSKEGCNRGKACRLAHPADKGKLAGKKECAFWLAGRCRYTANWTRYLHGRYKLAKYF